MNKEKHLFKICSLTISLLFFFLLVSVLLLIARKRQVAELPGYESVLVNYIKRLSEGKELLNTGGSLKIAQNIRLKSNNSFKSIKFITDKNGFRSDCELFVENPNNKKRILLIGDSFIVGFRTDQDEFIGKKLYEHLPDYDIYISHTESPVFALYYLQNFGYKFKFDYIILGVTLGNDITGDFQFVNIRNFFTLDNYIKDKSKIIQFNKNIFLFGKKRNYKLSKLLKSPYIKSKRSNSIKHLSVYERVKTKLKFRIFKKYSGDHITGTKDIFCYQNGFGYFMNPLPEEIQSAYEVHFEVIKRINVFCKWNNIPFITLLIPQKFQVYEENWEKTVEVFDLNPEYFDLDQPNKKIVEFFNREQILYIDLLPIFRRERFSFPGNLYFDNHDMHWSKFGQKLAANEIQKKIKYLNIHK